MLPSRRKFCVHHSAMHQFIIYLFFIAVDAAAGSSVTVGLIRTDLILFPLEGVTAKSNQVLKVWMHLQTAHFSFLLPSLSLSLSLSLSRPETTRRG